MAKTITRAQVIWDDGWYVRYRMPNGQERDAFFGGAPCPSPTRRAGTPDCASGRVASSRTIVSVTFGRHGA